MKTQFMARSPLHNWSNKINLNTASTRINGLFPYPTTISTIFPQQPADSRSWSAPRKRCTSCWPLTWTRFIWMVAGLPGGAMSHTSSPYIAVGITIPVLCGGLEQSSSAPPAGHTGWRHRSRPATLHRLAGGQAPIFPLAASNDINLKSGPKTNKDPL